MSYCGPRGIPYLHWLGGPMVWTQLDRDLALAWLTWERRRCPSCGLHPDDDPDDYRTVAHTCPGCVKIANTRKRAEQQGRTGDQPGVTWVLQYQPRDAREVDHAASGG